MYSSFNVGIEVGQIFIVILFMVMLWIYSSSSTGPLSGIFRIRSGIRDQVLRVEYTDHELKEAGKFKTLWKILTLELYHFLNVIFMVG